MWNARQNCICRSSFRRPAVNMSPNPSMLYSWKVRKTPRSPEKIYLSIFLSEIIQALRSFQIIDPGRKHFLFAFGGSCQIMRVQQEKQSEQRVSHPAPPVIRMMVWFQLVSTCLNMFQPICSDSDMQKEPTWSEYVPCNTNHSLLLVVRLSTLSMPLVPLESVQPHLKRSGHLRMRSCWKKCSHQ